jgi:hypothetical protein
MGVRVGFSFLVALGFALKIASRGPSKRIGSFLTYFLLFIYNFYTIIFIIGFVVKVSIIFSVF